MWISNWILYESIWERCCFYLRTNINEPYTLQPYSQSHRPHGSQPFHNFAWDNSWKSLSHEWGWWLEWSLRSFQPPAERWTAALWIALLGFIDPQIQSLFKIFVYLTFQYVPVFLCGTESSTEIGIEPGSWEYRWKAFHFSRLSMILNVLLSSRACSNLVWNVGSSPWFSMSKCARTVTSWTYCSLAFSRPSPVTQ